MAEPLIAISRKQAFIFACFFVFYEFLTYMANDMIMPAMLQVVHVFHASEAYVATSLTAYILGGASLQLILGPISDATGRRPSMLAGATLFVLFTLFIACANSMNQFLVARFFQGMGLCFIGVIGYATIQEIFEEMDAIRIIAIMSNAAILAPLLGPLLGAIVIHYAPWQLIFIIIGLCALLALWGLWRYMPEPIGAQKKDGKLIAKAPFAFQSILKNYKTLVSNPIFLFSALSIGILSVPCVAWIALSPIMLIQEAHLTVIQYGLWQLPIFGATIMGNWALHQLTYHYPIKTILLWGGILLILGIVLMALLPFLQGNHYSHLLPGTVIYFFALSIINAPLNRFCLFVTPISKGTTSALISLSIMIIGALGIEIANRVYEHHSNLYFGLFCNVVLALFLLCTALAFYYQKKNLLK